MIPFLRGPSLFAQLVLPVVGLLLAAVLANVAFTAWLEARHAVNAAKADRERLVALLDQSRISLVPPVLVALQKLTGSEFVVWDDTHDAPSASSLDDRVLEALTVPLRNALRTGTIEIEGQRYDVGVLRSAGVRPERALVLSPARSIVAMALDAVWPVLVVAAITLVVLVPLGLSTTGGLATRIRSVERHVERIARGEFGSSLPPGSDDEVGRLIAGINRMSVDLETLRNTLVSGERQRLLGQLAAGFAHELRNAITGARLAVELHRRRCHDHADDTSDQSLAVACRQLDIVEEEVRGLLALGRPAEAAVTLVSIDQLIGDVASLVGPRCDHAGVHFETSAPSGVSIEGRHEGLRAALVNLVLNAIDAAGRGGCVTVSVDGADSVRVTVEDDGPGPPAHLAASLHEPFVTGKAEGVGLGLAVATAVAEQHGGTLSWDRCDGRTRFHLQLPMPTRPSPIITEHDA